VHLIPVGHDAVLAEVTSSEEAVGLAAWARARGLARDVVPGSQTVLFDGVEAPQALGGLLVGWQPTAAQPGTTVEIPVTYDGPDLDLVAQQWACSVEEVVARHRSTEFVSAFCGFAPGFAYLSGLVDDVARRTTPRARVRAGSVGLAGRWCGVYPTESPGGWQVIGHADVDLWDVRRDPPALLAPGTRVRFRDASLRERASDRPGSS
jgi:KipI family sensor histidine kinase inhibitor